MCYAAAIPYVLGAISAAGAYQQAQSQKGQAEYQAKVATNNQTLAEMQATDAKARGDKSAADIRRKYAGLIGDQRAQLSAKGLDISDGNANALLNDSAFFAETDENTTRANAAREAWGLRTRAQNFAGDAAAASATAGAINPLLSAGLTYGTVAAKWYQGQGAPASGIWDPGYDDSSAMRGGWTGQH